MEELAIDYGILPEEKAKENLEENKKLTEFVRFYWINSKSEVEAS